MPGLLDRITSGVESLLNNEVVQGLGAAAAVGVNPAVGLLAVPGLRNSRERRELENEAAREQLDALQMQNDAREQLGGLFAQPNALETEQGQSLAAGLLAQLSPGSVAGQVFPQQTREPAIISAFRAAGINPTSDTGRQAILDHFGRSGASDEAMRTIQLQIAGLQLDEKRREREARERTERQQRLGRRNSIASSVGDIRKIFNANKNIEGTLLQSGVPFSEARRGGVALFTSILEGVGVDQSDRRQALTDFDTARKGFNDLVLESIDRFGGEGGTLTNDKLALLESALANENITAEASASILATILEENIQAAELEKFNIKELEGANELLQELRDFELGITDEQENEVPDVDFRGQLSRGFDAARVRASDVAKMSIDQLNELAQSGREMSEEALRAAADRYEELRNAR